MTNVKLQPHKKTTTGEALNDFIHLVFENHFTTLRAKRAKSVIVPTNRGKTGLFTSVIGTNYWGENSDETILAHLGLLKFGFVKQCNRVHFGK